MSHRAERAIGIALGILLGIAVIVVFVFFGSGHTVDAPSIKHGATTAPPAQPAP
jgi:hypothetical protein